MLAEELYQSVAEYKTKAWGDRVCEKRFPLDYGNMFVCLFALGDSRWGLRCRTFDFKMPCDLSWLHSSGLYFFPLFSLVFLSPSTHTRTQSVCDTAYRTSRPEHFSSVLCSLRLRDIRLKCPDLSRCDRARVLPPVLRETRWGPASSWTLGTASRSRTRTWAGLMTA